MLCRESFRRNSSDLVNGDGGNGDGARSVPTLSVKNPDICASWRGRQTHRPDLPPTRHTATLLSLYASSVPRPARTEPFDAVEKLLRPVASLRDMRITFLLTQLAEKCKAPRPRTTERDRPPHQLAHSWPARNLDHPSADFTERTVFDITITLRSEAVHAVHRRPYLRRRSWYSRHAEK